MLGGFTACQSGVHPLTSSAGAKFEAGLLATASYTAMSASALPAHKGRLSSHLLDLRSPCPFSLPSTPLPSRPYTSLTPATAEMDSPDASSDPSDAPSDLCEEIVRSQLIATVLGGDEPSSHESSSADSSFEETLGPLKRGLIAAKITPEDADKLILRCLDGVKSMELGDGASRTSTANW